MCFRLGDVPSEVSLSLQSCLPNKYPDFFLCATHPELRRRGQIPAEHSGHVGGFCCANTKEMHEGVSLFFFFSCLQIVIYKEKMKPAGHGNTHYGDICSLQWRGNGFLLKNI